MAGNGRSDVFVPSRRNFWGQSPSSIPIYPERLAILDTQIDWKETPEAHVFKADLPGFKKEEVNVEIEDGCLLWIYGERYLEIKGNNDKWLRVERSSGKVKWKFQLPEKPKLEQVKASMENGVLTVTVPKEEVKTPSIEISSG